MLKEIDLQKEGAGCSTILNPKFVQVEDNGITMDIIENNAFWDYPDNGQNIEVQ